MVVLLQMKLWEVLQKTGQKNVTKILKNTRKGYNTCETAGLILYFQNKKQPPAVFFKKRCS